MITVGDIIAYNKEKEAQAVAHYQRLIDEIEEHERVLDNIGEMKRMYAV